MRGRRLHKEHRSLRRGSGWALGFTFTVGALLLSMAVTAVASLVPADEGPTPRAVLHPLAPDASEPRFELYRSDPRTDPRWIGDDVIEIPSFGTPADFHD